MVQIFVGGTAPDYAGDSHTTILGLLTKIRDTFVSSGWVIINDSLLASNSEFTVRDVGNTIFLRIFHSGNELFIEGGNDVSFTLTSDDFRCGYAVDGDDTRLYMNCQDHVVGISTWSNQLNNQDIALAGYPDVFYHPTLGRDAWWVANVSTIGWMYAQTNNWLYDNSVWMSWNVAHSNEATNIETLGTYTYAGQGCQDIAIGMPYQLDNDIDNDKNCGYYHFNGRENSLDGSSALSPMYFLFGRNDLNGDDGDYGSGETKRGVPVNKGTPFTGYWNNFVRGCASEDQRTVITDPNTGFVYVVGGGFQKQGMRIA